MKREQAAIEERAELAKRKREREGKQNGDDMESKPLMDPKENEDKGDENKDPDNA